MRAKRRAGRITVYRPGEKPRVVRPGFFRKPSGRRWYIRTSHWKEIRAQAKIRDGFCCVRCGAADRRLEVHHLTYDRIGRELLDDVVTLCQPCHVRADRERRSRRRPRIAKSGAI